MPKLYDLTHKVTISGRQVTVSVSAQASDRSTFPEIKEIASSNKDTLTIQISPKAASSGFSLMAVTPVSASATFEVGNYKKIEILFERKKLSETPLTTKDCGSKKMLKEIKESSHIPGFFEKSNKEKSSEKSSEKSKCGKKVSPPKRSS